LNTENEIVRFQITEIAGMECRSKEETCKDDLDKQSKEQ
jgi:hypothetical protein